MSQASVGGAVAATAPAAKPKKTRVKAVAAHPKFLDMIKDAIETLKDRNGSSRQAISKVILTKYPSVNPDTMNSHIRKALKRGIETGALTRPQRSSATGATGKFKLGDTKPAKPANSKAVKKTAKKRPAKKAGATKTAKPAAKSPRKKKSAGKKTAGKKATKAKTKKAGSPKKKAKPAAKKAAKKPKAKKSPTKKAAKK
jgi:histone H1/5